MSFHITFLYLGLWSILEHAMFKCSWWLLSCFLGIPQWSLCRNFTVCSIPKWWVMEESFWTCSRVLKLRSSRTFWVRPVGRRKAAGRTVHACNHGFMTPLFISFPQSHDHGVYIGASFSLFCTYQKLIWNWGALNNEVVVSVSSKQKTTTTLFEVKRSVSCVFF